MPEITRYQEIEDLSRDNFSMLVTMTLESNLPVELPKRFIHVVVWKTFLKMANFRRIDKTTELIKKNM